jgi:hypothetical protein
VHGHSSESAQAWKTMPKQNSLAKAEERTRCAGLLRRSRSAARHHRSSPLQGFGGSGRAVADLGCRLGSSYKKSAEIRAEFRKTNSFYPH